MLKTAIKHKKVGVYRAIFGAEKFDYPVLLNNRVCKIIVPGGKILKINNRAGPSNRAGMNKNSHFLHSSWRYPFLSKHNSISFNNVPIFKHNYTYLLMKFFRNNVLIFPRHEFLSMEIAIVANIANILYTSGPNMSPRVNFSFNLPCL